MLLVGGEVGRMRGVREYRMIQRAGSEAAPCSLAELEDGKYPPQTFIRLGEHIRLYPASVYSITERSSTLNYVLVPILSPEGAAKQIRLDPDSKEPVLKKLRVVIRIERFKSVAEIPTKVAFEDEVSGLLVSEINELDTKEEELIQKAFPGADLSGVLIIKEGSKPYSLAWPIFEISLCVLMELIAGWIIIRAVLGLFRRKQPAD